MDLIGYDGWFDGVQAGSKLQLYDKGLVRSDWGSVRPVTTRV